MDEKLRTQGFFSNAADGFIKISNSVGFDRFETQLPCEMEEPDTISTNNPVLVLLLSYLI
jgi:hypothetical protein